MTINDFISSIDTKLYSRMRESKGDAECRRLLKEHYQKQCDIHVVSKSLPTIIEIDFDGHLKCQIETTDKAPTILKAVNSYGQPVDCNKDKIRINEI